MKLVACRPVTELPVIDCCTPLAGSSLEEERAAELELLFKALADRHRLRIVNLLLRADGEAVCLCEIQPLLGLSQGTVSHHLKQLVAAGLLERESRGTYSYFSLVPGALDSVREVFASPAACC
ncbi:MAG: ArsR family transcriptional regulator [Solirubrobacterales bacterium]|nr:ArsR family transcriptional regulator [Solirubrobacterales bacterium]